MATRNQENRGIDGNLTVTKRKFHVTVTQEDIDRATQNASTHCAVATALMGSIKGAARPIVDVQTVRFSLPEEHTRYVYMTPPAVQDYIIAFDAGDPIQPFEFTLTRLGWHGPTMENPGSGSKPPRYVATINAPRDEEDGPSNSHKDVLKDIQLRGKDGRNEGPPRSIRDREYGIRHMRRNQTGRKAEDTQ